MQGYLVIPNKVKDDIFVHLTKPWSRWKRIPKKKSKLILLVGYNLSQKPNISRQNKLTKSENLAEFFFTRKIWSSQSIHCIASHGRLEKSKIRRQSRISQVKKLSSANFHNFRVLIFWSLTTIQVQFRKWVLATQDCGINVGRVCIE